MNRGKRGSPYRFPESFMKFMMIWKQYLEGMARSMKDLDHIPGYVDYTTVWYRIHDPRPDLEIAGLACADIGTARDSWSVNSIKCCWVFKCR